MRIAYTTPEFVTEENYHGGLSNYLDGVTAYFASEYGYDVHVFVLSQFSGRIHHRNVTVHRIKRVGKRLRFKVADTILRPIISNRLQSFYRARENSKRIYKAFRREHRQMPFFIVQAASYLHTGYEIARMPTHPCAVVTRFSSSQQLWNAAYGKVYDPATAVHSSFEALQGYHSDANFCPSFLLRDHLQPLVGRAIEVIESPWNMADEVETDMSLYHKLTAGKQYLLFYGSLGRLKGIEVLAEIIHDLFDSYPDLHFVFIGKDLGRLGGGSAVEHLRKSASEYADRIIYSPPISRERIVPFIQNSRAVVLPSLVDNLPNTCIESMGLGALVVGTRGASFEQLITDGHNGFLAESGNSLSLLNAIDQALALRPKQKSIFGKHARDTIQRLEPSVSVGELDKFYRKILEGVYINNNGKGRAS